MPWWRMLAEDLDLSVTRMATDCGSSSAERKETVVRRGADPFSPLPVLGTPRLARMRMIAAPLAGDLTLLQFLDGGMLMDVNVSVRSGKGRRAWSFWITPQASRRRAS